MQIEIKCKGSFKLPYNQINSIQGNLKELSKDNYQKLRKEIAETGFAFPVNVTKHPEKGWVTQDGWHRVLVVKTMVEQEGFKCPDLPCTEIDWESDEMAARRILQGSSQYAHTTDDGMYAFIEEFKIEPESLDLNFDVPHLDFDKFNDEFYKEPTEGEDDVPENVPAKSKLGDLYQLGDHRLLCGDSTDIAQVERLMNGEKSDLWLTDPPYGVSYKSNGSEDKHREIENDNLPLTEMKSFWQKVAENALLNCSDEAAYYWFACQGGDQMIMMMALGDASWKVRHELIWVKDSMVMGRCDYHYKHEPILYGWKSKGKHHWHSDRTQTSVLEFPRPKRSDSHPTMKPVELLEYLMQNNTQKNESVLDTFGGSGSTLIACEKTARKCFMMEIDPHYCDIIVARWEKFTGKTATLITP